MTPAEQNSQTNANRSPDFTFTCPRLNLTCCFVVIGVYCAWVIVFPIVWNRIEPFEPNAKFRMPFTLSQDYALFERLIQSAHQDENILLIGDSVIWGEYVAPGDSLSDCLNRELASDLFINGGVNGLHPLAMEGLVRYYGKQLGGRPVVLHCNLLWMSSVDRDLSGSKPNQSFNHAPLVSQIQYAWPFVTSEVPAYQADLTERTGVAIQRELAFRNTVSHIRQVYFSGLDLHAWSIQHPTSNPLHEITLEIPPPGMDLRHKSQPWHESGIQPLALEWLPADESLQWIAFRRMLKDLESRHAQVFVVVGPFNSHLLAPDNVPSFQTLKNSIVDWLRKEKVPFCAMDALPTDVYGDASHPLAEGYRVFASNLMNDVAFQNWLQENKLSARIE